MAETDVEIRTKHLIDRLKATCGQYGLGNDGNEYKIITEVFLYKYMNDMFCKFTHCSLSYSIIP